MQLKPGTRMRSAVCDTQVMVIAAPESSVDLTCGGSPMIDIDAAAPDGASPAEDSSGGTLMGKRYVDSGGTLELLCTKPGAGSLAVGGESLTVKSAKPLPASD